MIEIDSPLLTLKNNDLKNLKYILEKLLSLSMKLQIIEKYKKAQESADDPKKKKERKLQFNNKCSIIYRYYQRLIDSGVSKPEAMQKTKTTFNIGYYDSEIYIAEGKRTAKRQQSDKRQDIGPEKLRGRTDQHDLKTKKPILDRKASII